MQVGGTGDWPPGATTIQKGDVLPVEAVEEILGMERDEPKFRLGLMNLVGQYEKHFKVHRGEPIVMVTSDGAILFLTDEQAVGVQKRRIDNHMAGVVRNHRRAIDIDEEELSDGSRSALDRLLVITGAVVAGMRKGYQDGVRRLRARPHVRSTPTLGPREDEDEGNED